MTIDFYSRLSFWFCACANKRGFQTQSISTESVSEVQYLARFGRVISWIVYVGFLHCYCRVSDSLVYSALVLGSEAHDSVRARTLSLTIPLVDCRSRHWTKEAPSDVPWEIPSQSSINSAPTIRDKYFCIYLRLQVLSGAIISVEFWEIASEWGKLNRNHY